MARVGPHPRLRALFPSPARAAQPRARAGRNGTPAACEGGPRVSGIAAQGASTHTRRAPIRAAVRHARVTQQQQHRRPATGARIAARNTGAELWS
eukprot:gene42484-38176_t